MVGRVGLPSRCRLDGIVRARVGGGSAGWRSSINPFVVSTSSFLGFNFSKKRGSLMNTLEAAKAVGKRASVTADGLRALVRIVDVKGAYGVVRILVESLDPITGETTGAAIRWIDAARVESVE